MSRSVQASFWIACVIIPTLTLTQEVVRPEGRGQWGPWTSWSVCSETCGTGLAYRVRHCHRSAGGGGRECSGQHKQHQACNRQECEGDQEDYRTVECKKRDGMSYGGRRYQWEAFINPYARCELACKARHRRYYARFRKQVQDGTPCKHDKDALCLAGKCLDVGCDGVLGSGAIVDECGICGGDGSTCRVISGIFTRTRLRQYGYHHVTTLPAGACNVNITELARSRNYLALTTKAGKNIVNGDKQLRPLGEYEGAGTTFDYRRRSGPWCPGACIFADGPLAESVDVQILYYDRNPGIMYHFTVPQHTANAVMTSANTSHHHHNHHHNDNHHTPHRQPTGSHRPSSSRQEDTRRPGVSQHGKRRRHRNRDPSSRRNKKPQGKLASLSQLPPAEEEASSSSSSSSRYDSTTSSLRNPSPSLPRQPSSVGGGRRGRPGKGSGQASSGSSSTSSSSPREELSPGGRLRPQHRPSSQASRRAGGQHQQPGAGESPFEVPPSVLPNVASGPRYVPPEGEAGGEGGGEGAPIEYRHYYHVDSDHYRRHSQRGSGGDRFAALNSGGQQWPSRGNELVNAGDVSRRRTGSGSEALSRPNLIPATHGARWRWQGPGSDVNNNDVNNAVGDVPLAVPASGYFVWTISGFSACSRPCGGGTQETVVVCMKSDTRVVVMGENCDVSARPSPTTVECNTQPCDPEWTEEDWSACSVSCGHGVQTRTVECKQRISPTLHLSVSADRCSNPKPPVTQFCRQPPCFQWQASNWTDCSTNCGLGERTRRAWCVNGEGQEVEASRCSQERPRVRVICDMGSCAKGWYYSRWSKKCSPECGAKTYKRRQVHCAAEDGGLLSDDRCPAHKKPRTRKSCGVAKPCGGKWFSGPWSPCNATCGEAWRQREVVCLKKHGRRLWGVVGKENCLRKERPAARELCSDLPDCLPEWYMTHWSECSKPCGTGTKTREVKCLDVSQQPSLSCNAKRRPQERRPCNKNPCDDDDDSNNNNSYSPNQRRHDNDYDHGRQTQSASKQQPKQRYQESTSPNTTVQRYHREREGHRNRNRNQNRTRHQRGPMALQASAPARVSVQQDIRSALGDTTAEDSHQHHRRRHPPHNHYNRHHQVTSSSHAPQPTTDQSNDLDLTSDTGRGPPTTTTSTTTTTSASEQQRAPTTRAVDPQCKDKPSGRWCLFVSQARLCGYAHYKKRCCRTCSKYNLHH